MLRHLNAVRAAALSFIQSCQGREVGEYKYSQEGAANLYSSCYALMSRHYLADLNLPDSDRRSWAAYIKNWQQEDGSFLGPELLAQLPEGSKHNLEHLKLHLTITVLPCLALLGESPDRTLRFAHKFVDPSYLATWLSRRDLSDAWLEGNNILFVMQLLVYLRDVEAVAGADLALCAVFDWLDKNVDPRTGLWGTDGHCSEFNAMCGVYHQLLIYYSEGRPINSPSALVDTTLRLQHADGGFSPYGGGGACEDVDAVDILVNLYKRVDYKRPEIRFALRRAFQAVLRSAGVDGGFVYRRGEEFIHMGMPLTRTPANRSTMFATWFRLHTLALIAEVLLPGGAARAGWGFNSTPSMGWHDVSLIAQGRESMLAEVTEEIGAVGVYQYLKLWLGYERIVAAKKVVRRVRQLLPRH